MSKVLPAASPAADPALLLFSDLELRDELQQAVLESGYIQPTPIQAEIIPHVLSGRDVLAQSQTGSGKTAAFALPILSKIQVPARRQPQVLVLAPTRELAMQVSASFQQYGRNLAGLQIATIYGGQDYEVQFRQLSRFPQIVVGTPGRIIDHVNRGRLDLSGIECLVLDEADEMLNMGFLEDVQFVLERMPAERQITLFSATVPPAIRGIAERYLRDPVQVTIKQKTMTAESIHQRAVFVGVAEKMEVLSRFLEMETTDGVIVFTKTKEATITVAEYLMEQGYKTTALNGDMPQKVRERAIQQLKSGYLDILVATDVAARGLDVPRISHVFNFDLPHDSESYIHRIGRTGRAGRAGHAIVFLTGGQKSKLRLIERATKQPIEVVERPTARQINQRRVDRFKSRIREVIAGQDLNLFQKMVQELVGETPELSLEQVGAALAQMLQNGRPFLLEDRPTGRRHRDDHNDRFDRRPERSDRSDRSGRGDRAGHAEHNGRGDRPDRNDRRPDRPDRAERRPRGDRPESGDRGTKGPRREGKGKPVEARTPTSRSAPPASGMKRYRVEIGWDDGVKPGSLVGAIANEAGLDGRDIGTINIQDRHSFVDLPKNLPLDVVESLGMTKIRGKSLRLTPVIAKAKSSGRADYSKD
ncbi:MAG: DEAD/DEAH box helicase [Planctomycetaceae bacterium]|nr:DEAD/DEAH box helicase [Planctomycetaceae bacterium]